MCVFAHLMPFRGRYLQMQQLWRKYVSDARACCSEQYWTVFKAVQGQNIVCRDKVMHAVKTLMPQNNMKRRWPSTSRTLRALVERKAGNFWENVTVTRTIDLGAYNLPGCDAVTFSFMDPVYIWIDRCNALHDLGLPLEWDARTLHHPDTGEQVHGAGIQYSKILRQASVSYILSACPACKVCSYQNSLSVTKRHGVIDVHICTSMYRNAHLCVFLYICDTIFRLVHAYRQRVRLRFLMSIGTAAPQDSGREALCQFACRS